MSSVLEDERQRWLYQVYLDERCSHNGLVVSTHGLLLQYDIERAFRSGAWLSVIVLSQAAIESTIRQIETGDYKTKAKDIFDGDEMLQRVRSLRNEILHPQEPGSPSMLWSVPNADIAACHAKQEEDAKVAVKLVYRAMYAQIQRDPKPNSSLMRKDAVKPAPSA